MTKRSAARRAAALSHLMGTQLRLDLLREDRERVRMERAIQAWWEFHNHSTKFAHPVGKTFCAF
jgi:hypothetical protein